MKKQYQRKSAEERREEIEALSNQMMEHIKEEIASGNIQSVLDNVSKISYSYSLNNVLLIAVQRPDATTVAPITRWNEVNRKVSSGQKGIKIICPVITKHRSIVPKVDETTHEILKDANGKIITEVKTIEGISFRVGHVFDISQTEQIDGKEVIPLHIVHNLNGDIGDRYNDLLYAIRNTAPVPSEISQVKSSANGYFSLTEQKIIVKDGMSEKQTLKTFIHETAHSILHNNDKKKEHSIKYYVGKQDDERTQDNITIGSNLSEIIKKYKSHIDDNRVIGIVIETENGKEFVDIISNDSFAIHPSKQSLIETVDAQIAINNIKEVFPSDYFSIPSMREIQAEATAYLVASHYGIDTADYSIKYVTSWADMDTDIILNNLDASRVCAMEIIGKMDTVLSKLNDQQMKINSLSEYEIANEICELTKESHTQTELYSGSEVDSIFSKLRHQNTEEITDSLRQTAKNNPGTEKAVKAEMIANRIELNCKNTIDKEQKEARSVRLKL